MSIFDTYCIMTHSSISDAMNFEMSGAENRLIKFNLLNFSRLSDLIADKVKRLWF